MVKVYKCLLSGDEFISDSYKMLEVKDAEGNVVSDESESRLEVLKSLVVSEASKLVSKRQFCFRTVPQVICFWYKRLKPNTILTYFSPLS